ncbi:MAG: helix-turn-helix domain-containing protein [Richelia sp.]|nr:helix-turn-helix domain-containing protein [Richelia sp.]CDN15954.1 hypothetical protein RintRC_4560 [Richelia intracellularis]
MQHLGESKEQAQALLELVAREAISLTYRRLICQSHVDAVHTNNHEKFVECSEITELQPKVCNDNQIPPPQRVEILSQIGQTLRQAREAQNISLIELCSCTYVLISHIESIEQGKPELLPDDVFVHSFIKMLGNALGLDGESLAALVPTTQKPQSFVNTRKEVTKSQCKQSKLQFSPIHLYIIYI